MAHVTIRIDLDNGDQLGPGKVRLLELIGETGSIRKAAAHMKMSYRKAWLLLQSLEETFCEPLIATATGGRAGGGARLTPLGARVATQYRRIEAKASKAGAADLGALERASARKQSR